MVYFLYPDGYLDEVVDIKEDSVLSGKSSITAKDYIKSAEQGLGNKISFDQLPNVVQKEIKKLEI